MANIPSLGPRGEGWVALQSVGFALILGTSLVWRDRLGVLESPAFLWLGRVLFVAGGALVGWALIELHLSRSLTALPHPRAEGRLVETGAYRVVRHPVYSGLVLASIGWAIARASVPTLLAAGVLFVILDLKRRREEVWLADRYPGYAAYRRRTRALIPFVY